MRGDCTGHLSKKLVLEGTCYIDGDKFTDTPGAVKLLELQQVWAGGRQRRTPLEGRPQRRNGAFDGGASCDLRGGVGVSREHCPPFQLFQLLPLQPPASSMSQESLGDAVCIDMAPRLRALEKGA